MPQRKTDREAVLEEAETLFRQKGYGNTTMADIAKATGLLKGSLYYYFPSKEELALAILARVGEKLRGMVADRAYDESRPASVRWHAIMEATRAYFLETRGCLMGHMGLEVAEATLPFADRIRAFFEEWTAALAHVLQSAYGPEEAQRLANDAVARIEGAVLWLRICGDTGPLDRACDELAELL
ncbi:TetR/AcrR family transcriptional regulator [Thiohalorhabdus denitrificans]|uniref:Transcriptional regulator, TetR family n=1 Tax=Thiohalorhabdus denitrificans TaxID=381306 RepID=A0A1G5FAL2_9GAMM|nr:TetR/AcrR family transcriptional regulator [Thiohalorhabdus denitrificans]SCY36237.1 transcriptional regulator, TetR family [Thiohalorhabdus denitrificans]